MIGQKKKSAISKQNGGFVGGDGTFKLCIDSTILNVIYLSVIRHLRVHHLHVRAWPKIHEVKIMYYAFEFL